jgi:hypothetical protein
MGNGVGHRSQEAWNAFKANALWVIERREMTKNDVARPIEARGGPVSKTVYNALGADHPPNIETMQAIAEQLDIPLWILMVPNLPKELLEGAERKRFESIVADFFISNETGRTRIAETAANWGDLGRAKKTP